MRVIFTVENDGVKKYVNFCDMRMFGKVAALEPHEIAALREKYGPEPISTATTAEQFHKQILSKRSNIKNVLLDQSIISGLGNIYATDTLFLAKIHPETSSQKITAEQSERLLKFSKQILEEGILHRGSTLSDRMYIDAYGREGTHQNHFRIYGKSHCPECKSATEFIKINGRGTYYCPICQPFEGMMRLL
jgi:formamidopyrimidine-DNA glycosylase